MSYLLNYNPGTPQYTYPRRGGAKLSGTAIIHTAECAMDLEGDDSSAEVCASFIANRADYGSYHRLVDSDSIIDMVPWEYEAWQDSETNNWAVGISAAVQAGKWLTIPAARRDRIYRNMAVCAADFVRHMAGKGINVPLRRITGAEARSRVPGFCAHGDSGLYRSDPGTQFDWALFFEYTKQALSGGLSAMGTITPQEDTLSAAEVHEIKVWTQGQANGILNQVWKIGEAQNAMLKDIAHALGELKETSINVGGVELTAQKLAEEIAAAQLQNKEAYAKATADLLAARLQ